MLILIHLKKEKTEVLISLATLLLRISLVTVSVVPLTNHTLKACVHTKQIGIMSLDHNLDTHRTMVLHFIAIITWTRGYIKQKIIKRHTYNDTKTTGMIQSEFVYKFTIRA